MAELQAVVRRTARELTGADGATFVLKDGDFCYYADEDAIAPLWKGQRFPLTSCISGWSMMHRRHAAIEDIYGDLRIPHDVYRATFVKSLLMVPIRLHDPIGAIGNYWAQQHKITIREIELLQALANTTAVAMENIQVYQELEKRVRERTVQLEAANRELDQFSSAVSHDLRTPLGLIGGYAQMLEVHAGELNEKSKLCLTRIQGEVKNMTSMVEALLGLSRYATAELKREKFSISEMAVVEFERLGIQGEIEPDVEAEGDKALIQVVLQNLLSNAAKYSSKTQGPRVEVRAHGPNGFLVRDNGAGFDPDQAHKLFRPFKRLHSQEEYSGTGVGLATVQRIVHRHGGRIWGESAPGKGATFYVSLSG